MIPAVLLAALTIQSFSGPRQGTPYVLSTFGGRPGPAVKEGKLVLLRGWWPRGGPLSNAVAFPLTAPGTYRRVEASFTFTLSKGAHGGSFLLLDTAKYGKKGPAPKFTAWEEPNLPGVLALALDTWDPPTSQWFDGNGNIHHRPQREISIHFDGKELLNLLSPVEFRDEKPHRLKFTVQYGAGGAWLDLLLDQVPVLSRRFVPGIRPFESRAAFGGRTGEYTIDMTLDDIRVRWLDPAPALKIRPRPARVSTFHKTLIRMERRFARDTFLLPRPDLQVKRIILTLTLEPGPGGWDPWDRSASVYVFKGRERFEILRYITPFSRAWSWKADVTDYQSLLRGKTEMGLSIGSWVGGKDKRGRPKGFLVSVDLDYFPGRPARIAGEVRNLWNLDYHFGNSEEKILSAFPEKRIAVPSWAASAKLRFTVTGHGQTGEFTPLDRVLEINGRTFFNRLWKTDVYLNPCRPQGGTWKFDRAGWGPGWLVTPWDFDLAPFLGKNRVVRARYRPLPYRLAPGEKLQASHEVESQLILYRESGRGSTPPGKGGK